MHITAGASPNSSLHLQLSWAWHGHVAWRESFWWWWKEDEEHSGMIKRIGIAAATHAPSGLDMVSKRCAHGMGGMVHGMYYASGGMTTDRPFWHGVVGTGSPAWCALANKNRQAWDFPSGMPCWRDDRSARTVAFRHTQYLPCWQEGRFFTIIIPPPAIKLYKASFLSLSLLFSVSRPVSHCYPTVCPPEPALVPHPTPEKLLPTPPHIPTLAAWCGISAPPPFHGSFRTIQEPFRIIQTLSLLLLPPSSPSHPLLPLTWNAALPFLPLSLLSLSSSCPVTKLSFLLLLPSLSLSPSLSHAVIPVWSLGAGSFGMALRRPG